MSGCTHALQRELLGARHHRPIQRGPDSHIATLQRSLTTALVIQSATMNICDLASRELPLLGT